MSVLLLLSILSNLPIFTYPSNLCNLCVPSSRNYPLDPVYLIKPVYLKIKSF